VFGFDDSSIEKLKSGIIGSFRQFELVFSVSSMAVFGNELIGLNCPGLIANGFKGPSQQKNYPNTVQQLHPT
jgi:hypothetical protein